MLNAINSQLPLDIALQSISQRFGFHPRFDAIWRQYVYRVATVATRQPLLNRQVWQLAGERLNCENMREAAAMCLGEHDFAAFGAAPQQGSENTARQIFLSHWETDKKKYGTSYTYRIRGTAFLYHMVRRLVGTMAQVGRGRLTLGEFEEILLSRDIERAKVLAPPNGLILEEIRYPSSVAVDTSKRAVLAKADEAPLEERI